MYYNPITFILIYYYKLIGPNYVDWKKKLEHSAQAK